MWRKGYHMHAPEKFADHRCERCHLNYDIVLAAVYLEAKGYEFVRNFDCSNAEVLAESVYQMQVMMENQ